MEKIFSIPIRKKREGGRNYKATHNGDSNNVTRRTEKINASENIRKQNLLYQ